MSRQLTPEQQAALDPSLALQSARRGNELAARFLATNADRLTSREREEFDRSVSMQYQVAIRLLTGINDRLEHTPPTPAQVQRAWAIIRAANTRFLQLMTTANNRTASSQLQAEAQDAAHSFFNVASPVAQRVAEIDLGGWGWAAAIGLGLAAYAALKR